MDSHRIGVVLLKLFGAVSKLLDTRDIDPLIFTVNATYRDAATNLSAAVSLECPAG